MPKPTLDAKNLEILSELMLVEELAYKKCNHYSSQLSDDVLAKQCHDLAAHHKSRFDALFGYLQSHS